MIVAGSEGAIEEFGCRGDLMVCRCGVREKPVGFYEDVRHRPLPLPWVRSAHITGRDCRKDILSQSVAEVTGESLRRRLGKIVEPVLHEGFEPRSFCWRRFAPKRFDVVFADALYGVGGLSWCRSHDIATCVRA